ncbi:M48 family metallopeptidase [soil metagenome]
MILQAFDPVAATAAYMATLSPEAHDKATRYTQGGHWLLLWGFLVTLAIALVVVRSGVLVRVTGGLERGRPRRNLAVFVSALVFGLIGFVLSLPWSAYAGWWRQKQYGLSSQPFADWLTQGAIGGLISIVAAAIFYIALYALIRRARRFWWAWAGLVAAGFFVLAMLLAPTFIEPLFNKYTAAPTGQTRDAVVALAQKVGVPSDKIYIYNGSRQSNAYTANVSGLGGAARVAMSDTMFAKGADLAEVKGVVGHEMGHYARQHVLWGTLFMTVMAVIGFFLVDRLFESAARLLGAKGVADVGDPAGLPVLGVILAALSLISTPIQNTFSRWEEADADHFSLIHAHEPDGLSKALVKTIEYRASSPSDLEEFLFYDHPSVEHRVRAAMDWKAAHMSEVGR